MRLGAVTISDFRLFRCERLPFSACKGLKFKKEKKVKARHHGCALFSASKMAEDAGKQQIQLKVRGQDGSDTTFKVKKETRFEKIIAAYANQKGIAANSFRLMFDGKRINANDTPKMLELEDDDVVDCIMEQIGGVVEGEDASKQQITIRVRGQDGIEVSFKVKRETKFSKVCIKLLSAPRPCTAHRAITKIPWSQTPFCLPPPRS